MIFLIRAVIVQLSNGIACHNENTYFFQHLRLFLDNAELHEIVPFFEAYYSHVFYIVYDAFITAEVSLRQKGAHKAQREELEAVLYLFEKVRRKSWHTHRYKAAEGTGSAGWRNEFSTRCFLSDAHSLS